MQVQDALPVTQPAMSEDNLFELAHQKQSTNFISLFLSILTAILSRWTWVSRYQNVYSGFYWSWGWWRWWVV